MTKEELEKLIEEKAKEVTDSYLADQLKEQLRDKNSNPAKRKRS